MNSSFELSATVGELEDGAKCEAREDSRFRAEDIVECRYGPGPLKLCIVASDTRGNQLLSTV